jgi:hypothetical protein
MVTVFKYLYQVDGTYHDLIRFVAWSIILIDVAIIMLSIAKLLNHMGI